MSNPPWPIKIPGKSSYSLERFISLPEDEARAMFGMTVQEAHAEEVCVRCKRALSPDDYPASGSKFTALIPYRKFGMCLFCYEEWADEDFEGVARTYNENDRIVSALAKKVYSLTKELFPVGQGQAATSVLFDALREAGIDFRIRTDISPRRSAENIILKTRFGLQYGTDDWQRIVQHPAVASAMKPLEHDFDKWFGRLPEEDQIKIRLGCTESPNSNV